MSDSYINKLLIGLIILIIMWYLLGQNSLIGILFTMIPLIILYAMNIWLPARISRKEKEKANNPYNKDGDLSDK